jgi:MFS family permease
MSKPELEGITEVQVADAQAVDIDDLLEFDKRPKEWHSKFQKKLLRKLDLHILPVIVVMYLLNFLDRSNLSQARLGGLEKDLNMAGDDFNVVTSILFVGYLLMQIPSNILLVRVRPAIYLGTCMTIWGLISALQGGAVKSYGGLLACRFFLGFIEAPFFPGVIMLLSSWYTRNELAHRFALFYGGSQLGNMFGGLIAAGVLANLDGARGIAGWRWLFIIEGTITMFVALLSIVILPNYPSTTRWLSDEEKAYSEWRLHRDIGTLDDMYSVSLKEGIKLAFKDYKTYIFGLMMNANTLNQTFSYFFPTIVKTLGYSNTVTLLLTVPVWFAAFLFSVVFSWHASRTNERAFHICAAMLISCIGNILVISTTNNGARFFAMFLMPIGAFPGIQLILAWVVNSMPRPAAKRTVALAVANTMSNAANVYGSYLYQAQDGPRYVIGGIVIAVMAIVCIILTLVMRYCLIRENKRLERQEDPVLGIGFRHIL